MFILPWGNRKCWKQSWQLYLYCVFGRFTLYLYPCMVKNTHSWGLGQPTNTWLWPTIWQTVLQYPTSQLIWELMFLAFVFLVTYAMGHAFSCIQQSVWTETSPHSLKFTADSTKHVLSEKQEAVHWLNKVVPPETHFNTHVWIIKPQKKKWNIKWKNIHLYLKQEYIPNLIHLIQFHPNV